MNVKQAAEAWRFDIPEEELNRITPIVEEVTAAIGKVLDRDLSTVDPVPHFHPADG